MSNEYKGLRLHADRIEGCLLAFGVQSLVITAETAKNTRFEGTLGGKEVFFKLYETAKGYTIGYSTGKDREIFDVVAKEIVEKCSYAGKHNINLSIPNVPQDLLNKIEEYLIEKGARKQFDDEITAIRILTRWEGPRSDKVALTYYTTTKRLTVQGTNAHLASLILDILRMLMVDEDFLAIDLQAFEVPLTIAQAKSQIAARLPASHDWLNEPVRKLFSSAHSMAQTQQVLEDYCGVVSPALRGLEGFIKQVYCLKGAIPAEKIKIGEWFEQKVVGKWAMCEVPALHVGEQHAQILADAYSIYHAERHTTAHAGFDPENTRLIESLADAQGIVNRVLDFVEGACAKIRA